MKAITKGPHIDWWACADGKCRCRIVLRFKALPFDPLAALPFAWPESLPIDSLAEVERLVARYFEVGVAPVTWLGLPLVTA